MSAYLPNVLSHAELPKLHIAAQGHKDIIWFDVFVNYATRVDIGDCFKLCWVSVIKDLSIIDAIFQRTNCLKSRLASDMSKPSPCMMASRLPGSQNSIVIRAFPSCATILAEL